MNDLKMFKDEKSVNDIQVISSREVADMMGKQHWEVLRMLEGYEPSKGSKSRKVVGIIPTLNDHNVGVVNYFIESTYVDAKGETRKCYECTKMGCEILGNKLTGKRVYYLLLNMLVSLMKWKSTLKSKNLRCQLHIRKHYNIYCYR